MPVQVGAHTVEIGASVGLAIAGTRTPSIEALLKAADAAMYRAKRERRSTFQMSDLLPAPSPGLPRIEPAGE